MTREQAIEHGKSQLEVFGGEHREFIKLAIETMRKYQKIEQIMKDIPYGGMATVRRIEEVMEDATN